MGEPMKDMAGGDLNEAEQKLVEAYRMLSNVLMGHRDQLSPFEERNAIKALAALWQIMNGVDMDPGQVYELGA
jgi:hypothetical protein